MFSLFLSIIYLAFISLGLPDSMLGAAWPHMHTGFAVPLSYAGIISAIIAAGTILSSLRSDYLTAKLGTGVVTAGSVAMTAAALWGFSVTGSFPGLCLWAIPYGLGAGSVDAALNNYVALHYESRHMSWLHCMWGVGAASGPYIMGRALAAGSGWQGGYRTVAILQILLTVILFLSLPLWKKTGADKDNTDDRRKPLALRDILRIRGAKEVCICFFCYCAVEQTAGLWASSYMNLYHGVPADTAAVFGSLFFLGITAGRAASGFLTMRLSDWKMVRLGQALILIGIAIMLIPAGKAISPAGLVLIGLGCAPIYPCIIHSTPAHFGADKSQAIIGVQMASAYMGTLGMPPLFGIIAGHVSIALLPLFLLALLILMVLLHERLNKVA